MVKDRMADSSVIYVLEPWMIFYHQSRKCLKLTGVAACEEERDSRELLEYYYFTDKKEIIVPFYNDSTAHFTFDNGKITLRQTTGYPVNGDVKLEVIASDAIEEKVLRLFVPSWTRKESVRLSIDNKDKGINKNFV